MLSYVLHLLGVEHAISHFSMMEKSTMAFFIYIICKGEVLISTQNKSSYMKAALRKGFREGTSKLADRKYFGYRQTPDGVLTIVP